MRYPPLWDNKVEERVRAEARNLDEQARPDHVQMCVRCVMTSARPRIQFDEAGVCSACRHAERKKTGIDWAEREVMLAKLLEDRRDEGRYDVVVPCSGGKDSSFVASTLRDKWKMNPICATWAPHIYTDIGWRNIQSFIHHGFDVVTAQPNGFLHRKLARLALEFYGDNFLPFIYGQLFWPMHVAAQNDVDLVFFGESGEAEYGGDPSANDKPCWGHEDWERIYMKGAAFRDLLALGQHLGAISEQEAWAACPYYEMPKVDQPPEFHWLGYYVPWHPQSNYYTACEKTGFEANPERSPGTYSKYASIDDKLDALHYRFGFLKFGIGRATSDAAHEVRDGELTREEALTLVAQYDDEHPAASPHFEECLTYLGLERDWYEQIEERFRADLPADRPPQREKRKSDPAHQI